MRNQKQQRNCLLTNVSAPKHIIIALYCLEQNGTDRHINIKPNDSRPALDNIYNIFIFIFIFGLKVEFGVVSKRKNSKRKKCNSNAKEIAKQVHAISIHFNASHAG